MPRILFIPKVPLVERLPGEAIARLDASGAMSEASLRDSARRQQLAIGAVRRALAGLDVRERRIDELQPGDAADQPVDHLRLALHHLRQVQAHRKRGGIVGPQHPGGIGRQRLG